MEQLESYDFDNGYDYAVEPDENLLCPICRNPFVDPVMCESTDHIFCRLCLIKSLEVSSTCPIDRLPLSLSLVTPAPKVVFSILDELLVSCPFKSKFDCSFVCQRYLIQTHVQSHSCQIAYLKKQKAKNIPATEPIACSELACGENDEATNLPRFRWKNGVLSRCRQESTRILSSSCSRCSSDSQRSKCEDTGSKSASNVKCPFERFGCSFVGSSEALESFHLKISQPESDGQSEELSACRLFPFREILEGYAQLEKRNRQLKDQLEKSRLKQSQLKKTIDCQKTSLKELAQQIDDYTHSDPLLAISSPLHEHLQSLPQPSVNTNVLIAHNHDPSLGALENNSHSLADNVRPMNARMITDPVLHSAGSRMNYGGIHGNRLRSLDTHSPTSGCLSSAIPHPFSSHSATTPTIRVSTFLRRGEILTPTSERQLNRWRHFHPEEQRTHNSTPQEPKSPITTALSSDGTSEGSEQREDRRLFTTETHHGRARAPTLKHTALPKIETQPFAESSHLTTRRQRIDSHRTAIVPRSCIEEDDEERDEDEARIEKRGSLKEVRRLEELTRRLKEIAGIFINEGEEPKHKEEDELNGSGSGGSDSSKNLLKKMIEDDIEPNLEQKKEGGRRGGEIQQDRVILRDEDGALNLPGNDDRRIDGRCDRKKNRIDRSDHSSSSSSSSSTSFENRNNCFNHRYKSSMKL